MVTIIREFVEAYVPGTVLSTSGTLFHLIVPKGTLTRCPVQIRNGSWKSNMLGTVLKLHMDALGHVHSIPTGASVVSSLYTGVEIRYRGMKQMAAEDWGDLTQMQQQRWSRMSRLSVSRDQA